MRTYNSRVVVAAGALAVLAAAGCTHSGNNGPAPSSTSPTSSSAAPSTTSTGAQFDIGNTVNYGSMGTTTSLDCGDGKSLNVGGSNNTLTVKGTCGTVSIGGADNKITIDKIDKQLNVVGFNNTITYRDGEPKVDNLGSGNTISKSG
ncbi:DUF3060 domain-containing protein [Candidatus Mycobacterium wuenschmannii]|uniref:DUF3060 domain-containing protein n=1 Tax=Candidatus Mycobacterium wuenschmannii TaxID=3027808 RepID=A0ABY8VXJ1_9MYCO|nr:DUF3060 domain-containing protein [Candidatus Mycobacterium wuenschmannii]WIM87524.1 DUF3060 domain-containing protein [Candidatus Mycobacterium wuenschmannii]